jgi:two-component system, sensor histidine kinase and response regulator
MNAQPNRRILVVDDNEAIQTDYRKILGGIGTQENSGLTDLESDLFGEEERQPVQIVEPYEISVASQGPEALALVERSIAEGRPFAMVFMDVRMPPGWDGIETIERLWKVDSELQAVICTAYSDYSWSETIARLGSTDRLLILKKPFDSIEVCQLASALVEKWNLRRRERSSLEAARAAEREARAYAASLETVNRALETSKAAAERSSEMKTDFLVHLSREISAKVCGVVGDVELLRSPGAGAGLSLEKLDAVLHSSSYLLATLEEAADIALIDSGKLELQRQVFDPAAPMEEAARELRPLAEAKGLELCVERRGAPPGAVIGDPERITRILHNLLSNAIQCTEQGSIRFTLESRPSRSASEARLCYGVEDTGSGIPRQRIGRLFEPFASAPDGQCRAGLGLAHAQRLARLLGGDIRVESEPGRGSRFDLALDLGVPAPGDLLRHGLV